MLSAISSTGTIILDDGTLSLLVGHDGWGPAKLRRIMEQGHQQHGATHRGFRLEPRLGMLTLLLTGSTQSEQYTKRASLASLFVPQETIKLNWLLPNGSERQIDCVTNEVLAPWVPKMWTNTKAVVSLLAPDPTFYDPTQVTVNFNLSSGGTGWAIPWPIPWSLGASDIIQTVNINYLGTFLTYPLIRIEGPITGAKITNLSTGDKIDFGSNTIASGDYYEIDCNYGAKTVVDSAGVNRIDKLSDDSDLATFAVVPSPDAIGGLNSVKVEGSAADGDTQVYFQFFTRYIGI